jgi:hypothetical protein
MLASSLGTKAPNKRRSWLAAPAPLQYARADNDAQFLAQVTNPKVFVIASYNSVLDHRSKVRAFGCVTSRQHLRR